MEMRRGVPLFLLVALFTPALSQVMTVPENPSPTQETLLERKSGGSDGGYSRPGEKTKLRAYFFDVAGPYPILGAALAAGINQADNTPPEWKQGAEGYGKRFGSDFGIAAITTTTRYALAEAFREDTVYYRCDCTGILPRLGHALISTVTARRGAEGRRVFSIPSVVAPYAGTMTAVYVWYPKRYDAEDAFRMGNYNLLGFAGGNIALEFLYGGPHTLLSHVHIKSN